MVNIRKKHLRARVSRPGGAVTGKMAEDGDGSISDQVGMIRKMADDGHLKFGSQPLARGPHPTARPSGSLDPCPLSVSK